MSLVPGEVVWATFGPGRGREQAGRRPAVVIAGAGYLDVVEHLAIVVPVTTRDRRRVNHVPVTGDVFLPRPSWAMSEQVGTIDRERIHRSLGLVDDSCLRRIREFVALFLGVAS